MARRRKPEAQREDAHSNLPDLSQKNTLVTGAAHGIGEGIARLFARQGASVAVVDKKGKAASGVAESIRQQGGAAESFRCDIGKKGSIDRMLSDVQRKFGETHILVNNAFFWNFKRFEEQTWDDLCKFADVNFTGTTYLTQRIIKSMREKVIRGAVIFISSIHEETVRRLHPPYSMCKAGLKMLTKELAVEYGPYRIRVNAIAPGHVETDSPDRADNPYIPLGGQSALPEDIAKMAAILASEDAAGHVTGVSIPVDGGERLYGEWTDRLKP